ncbi:isoprenyl transferase [Thermaerobacter sp. FW80]|nr:isoprenyl transferase [Thermaerobacter sp. FW80]
MTDPVTQRGPSVPPPEEAELLRRVERVRAMGRMPRHVAIIMDGNGRWAQRRGWPRVAGHRAGVESVRAIVRFAGDIGLEVLTLYAFSTENWRRPPAEVRALMGLLVEHIRRDLDELDRNGVQIRVIGDPEGLPPTPRREVLRAVETTRSNGRMILVLALNYGARWELARAARLLAAKAARGEIDPQAIDEAMLAAHLQTADLPDPDLVIRPSGEWRISNFLLWQIAYSELWFTPIAWPDFRPVHLVEAIEAYAHRERRFGGLGPGAGRPGGAMAPGEVPGSSPPGPPRLRPPADAGQGAGGTDGGREDPAGCGPADAPGRLLGRGGAGVGAAPPQAVSPGGDTGGWPWADGAPGDGAGTPAGRGATRAPVTTGGGQPPAAPGGGRRPGGEAGAEGRC